MEEPTASHWHVLGKIARTHVVDVRGGVDEFYDWDELLCIRRSHSSVYELAFCVDRNQPDAPRPKGGFQCESGLAPIDDFRFYVGSGGGYERIELLANAVASMKSYIEDVETARDQWRKARR